jgi:hypothetical protein
MHALPNIVPSIQLQKKIRTPKYAASGVIFACGCSRALLPRLCVRGVEPFLHLPPSFHPLPVGDLVRPLLLLVLVLLLLLPTGRSSRHLSHNYALSAAASLLLPALHIEILLGAPVGPVGASCYVARHLLVVAPDLADEIIEGIVDVDTRLGGRLDEFAAE